MGIGLYKWNEFYQIWAVLCIDSFNSTIIKPIFNCWLFNYTSPYKDGVPNHTVSFLGTENHGGMFGYQIYAPSCLDSSNKAVYQMAPEMK